MMASHWRASGYSSIANCNSMWSVNCMVICRKNGLFFSNIKSTTCIIYLVSLVSRRKFAKETSRMIPSHHIKVKFYRGNNDLQTWPVHEKVSIACRAHNGIEVTSSASASA
jgi:hypothetical protein